MEKARVEQPWQEQPVEWGRVHSQARDMADWITSGLEEGNFKPFLEINGRRRLAASHYQRAVITSPESFQTIFRPLPDVVDQDHPNRLPVLRRYRLIRLYEEDHPDSLLIDVITSTSSTLMMFELAEGGVLTAVWYHNSKPLAFDRAHADLLDEVYLAAAVDYGPA